MTQPQPASAHRPGQMTAVMRAVAQAAGPKILRIGVVHGGKVVDERLIKQRTNVTIGPSERSMFVVPSRKLPPNFKLFEIVQGEYFLNYLDGMGGRVALKTGVSELSALKAQAKQISVGSVQFYRVRLTDDARGKIVVGETTFLFQFVVPPPPQPRPQLPVSVQKGAFGDIDWFTTIVAAFSFLLHFFLVALVYSDWMDPVVDDDRVVMDLIESVKSLPPPPPDLNKPEVDADSDAKGTTADADKGDSKDKGGSKLKGTAASNAKGDAKAEADAKAAEIASELAALEVETLGALNSGGVAVEGVLGTSEVPTGLIDSAAASGMGASASGGEGLKFGSATGSGSVIPGAGGSGKSLKDIGETEGSGATSGAAAAGTAKEVKGPVGSVSASAGVSGGSVANAARVVARMRGRFRSCYQRGLATNPEMAGSVTLTAKLGPNGEVQSVSGGGGGALAPIVPCLKAVVSSGGFAPPEGGSGAVITIPISFVVQQ